MTHSGTFTAILRNGLLALLFGTLAACGGATSSQSEATTVTVKVSASPVDTSSSSSTVGGTDTAQTENPSPAQTVTPDPVPAENTVITSTDTPQVSAAVIHDISLTLSWQPNPGDDMDGYIVYYGPDANTVNTEVSTITTSTAGFDPSAPSIRFNSWSDLGVLPGNSVCFKVRAYNSIGTSDPSPAICDVIPSAA